MSSYDRLLETIGQNVDRRRKEQGLSFRDLAFKSDIEKASLVRICSQGRNITVKTLHKIAQALEVSPSELLEEPPESNDE